MGPLRRKPQPDTGQFWTRVEERVRGQVPKVRVSYTVRMCQHCGDAPCMAAAPEAVYRRDDGLVIVDPEKARGLRELVEACPYGAIYYNEGLDLPQKCTGCAHLVDAGEGCPTAWTCARTGPCASATRRTSPRRSPRPRRSSPSAPRPTARACTT